MTSLDLAYYLAGIKTALWVIGACQALTCTAVLLLALISSRKEK